MDRLVSITTFVRVAESGFTAAARRLNASTAAVSENVQAPENALGVRLRPTEKSGWPMEAYVVIIRHRWTTGQYFGLVALELR